MDTMKAVRIQQFGGPETIKLESIPKPQVAAGLILVQVQATAINPIDWKLREGIFKDLPLPFTPGGDFCGIVEAIGEGVNDFHIGDDIFGCAAGSIGADAEYLIVPPTNAALKPKSLTAIEAASVPLVGMTAWQGLFNHGELMEGQTVLILGASGGVGSIAVQLAKLAKARIIGTASTENLLRVRDLGCDIVVDHRKERFEDVANDVDLCLDLVGGDSQKRAFYTVRQGGRLVSTVRPPDQELAKKRNITALMFRQKPEAEQLKSLAHIIDAGQLKIQVAKVLPLERAAEAEELNRKHEIDGKIVLTVDASPQKT